MSTSEHIAIDLDAPPAGPGRAPSRRAKAWLAVGLVTLGLVLALVTHHADRTAPAPVAGPQDLMLTDDGSVGENAIEDGTVVIAVEFENYGRNPVTASKPVIVMAPGFAPTLVQIIPGTSGDVITRRPGYSSGAPLLVAPQEHASVLITFHLACTVPKIYGSYVQSISVTASADGRSAIRELTPDLSGLTSAIWQGACQQ